MHPLLRRLGATTLVGCVAAVGLVGTAAPASAATGAPTLPGTVVVNEIESDGGTPGDWIELANTTSAPVDVSGLVLKDNDDTHAFTLPAGTTLPALGFLVVDESTDPAAGLSFGLGKADSVRLFDADGTTLLDSYSWTAAAATTYGRLPDRTGAFGVTPASSKGTANAAATTPTPTPTDPGTTPAPAPAPTPAPTPAPAPVTTTLRINEVESNGDDTDWVELTNVGSTAVDVSGWSFLDGDDSHAKYVLPAGSTVAPGGFFVIDQAQGVRPGFDFGLGGADSARVYDTSGALALTYSWTEHSLVSYGRCPDGTGEFATTTTSTKGGANDCSSPVRLNEIESSGGTPGDWVELTTVGATPVDVSGFVLSDSDDTHRYVLPTGSVIQPGGFLVLDELTTTTPAGFDFGLGGADSVRLFARDGVTLVDSYAWTQHAAVTWGRSPDGTGDVTGTLEATKGSANIAAGTVLTQPWPGGPDELPLDDEATFTGDLSGLDYEPSGTSADGTLWAVQNGDGLLYRIVSDGAGGWAPATDSGWTAGKALRYPDGTGRVDAEGVTVTGDSSDGGVYVSSERNNAASSVSRPSVLRYDVAAAGGATTLVATQEWDLAADFPGLGANAGLEGVTWVPDAWLTERGFVDESTGAAYDPAARPGHGDGLFFVGVEGTASVYAYALSTDGSAERVATIATSFDLVADVQFDADLDALWVVCDEACSGRTALFDVDASGAFAEQVVYEAPLNADRGLANEGFAVADAATCTDGVRQTFYADDADTDGFSLRAGTLPCDAPTAPTDPTTPVVPGTGAGAPGTGTGTGTGTGAVPAGTTPTRVVGTPARAGGLAYTGGADARLGAALAALLLLAGAGGVLVSRRRA